MLSKEMPAPAFADKGLKWGTIGIEDFKNASRKYAKTPRWSNSLIFNFSLRTLRLCVRIISASLFAGKQPQSYLDKCQ